VGSAERKETPKARKDQDLALVKTSAAQPETNLALGFAWFDRAADKP